MPIQEIDYDPFAEQYVKEKELQKRRNILEVDYDPFVQDEDSPAAAPPKREALQPPASKVGTLGGVASALGQGLAEGVTTAIPEMVGESLEFVGSYLPGQAVESIGKDLKEWAEAKGKSLYGEPKKREGLERWVYEGSKMLAPSIVPAGAVGMGVRVLTGVGKLVKAGKAAQAAAKAAATAEEAAVLTGRATEYFDAATKAAKLANNVAAVSTGALFGTAQAQSTRDNAERQAAKLEAEGDFEGARQAREAGKGWAPISSGAIEAGGEFFGTKYLGKLFRLDEAGVAKRGAKQLVSDFLKTLGVEVGTEMGQQGGEAYVEKVSGIRPEADPLAEALDVIGPTAFMIILTGGAAGAVNTMRRPDDAVDLLEDEKTKDQPDITETIRQAIGEQKKAEAQVKPRPSTAKEAAETFFGKEAVQNEQAIESLRRRGLYVPEDQAPVKSAEESARVFEEEQARRQGEAVRAAAPPARVAVPIGEPQLGVRPEARTMPEEAVPGGTSAGTSGTSAELPLFEPASEIEKIDQAGNEAATSPLNDRPQPTEAQKDAGNYAKGHVKLHGLDISIENPRGSERAGTDKAGKPWSVVMEHPYGYIRGTQGRDKDHLDVFIGPDPESPKAFVVDQVNPETGKWDEHKVLLGFESEEEARKGYLDNYQEGWKGLGAITEMPVDEFKAWAKSGPKTKPVAYKEAKDAGEVSGDQRSDVRKEESGVEKAAPGTGIVLGGEKTPVRREPVLGGENLQRGKEAGRGTGERAGLTEPGEKKAPAPTPKKAEIVAPAPAGEAVAPKSKGFDPENDRQRSIFVSEILKSDAPEVKAMMKQAEEAWPGEDPGPVVESQIDYDLQKVPEKWLNTEAGKEIIARKGWGEKAALPEPERAEETKTLYRGTERGRTGEWYTPDKEAAEEYANLHEIGDVEQRIIDKGNFAGPKDIIATAKKLGIDTEKESAYGLVSDQYPEVLAALKENGFDGVHLPEGEDFAPSGKAIESYRIFEKPPSQEKVSEEVKSLILHDMRTALEEGHKYGMRDDETAGQGSNVTPIGTTNPPWLMEIVREMKKRHQQTIGKAEIQAVIRKEIESNGRNFTPKQLKIWFIIEEHLRNESFTPHYIRAAEVMSGAKDALVDEFSNRLEAGEYDNAFSDLSFPPTEKEIETAAINVVASEVANGNEEVLKAYQAERGEAHREENEAPPAESRAEEVTPKTEKTKAGEQGVMPGMSEAETFDLTPAAGEIGISAPTTAAGPKTATIEEVAKAVEEKPLAEKSMNELVKDAFSIINDHIKNSQGMGFAGTQILNDELFQKLKPIFVEIARRAKAKAYDVKSYIMGAVDEKPDDQVKAVWIEAAERYIEEEAGPKIQYQKVMGVDAVVDMTKTIDGIKYDLLYAKDVEDKRGFILVTDLESGRVVSVNAYPTRDQAETKYAEGVYGAKKATEPAEEPKPEPAAAAPTQSLADELFRGFNLRVTKDTTKNGNEVWTVSGATKFYKEQLKAAGGRWYGPKKVWSFYKGGDPTEKILGILRGQKAEERPEVKEESAKTPEAAPTKTPYEYGKAAFERGLKRMPALDVDFMLTAQGKYHTKAAYDQWFRGWDLANIAAPVEEAPETALTKKEATAYGAVSAWVSDKIKKHTPFTREELFDKAAEAFGGTLAEGTFSAKDAYDAMELGINDYIDSVGNLTLNPAGPSEAKWAKERIKALKTINDIIPTQTTRTAEMDEFQQFSTPPAFAYVANWVANIKEGETYLEPSAGTGNLAVFGKIAGARVIVNEISPRRVSVLKELGFARIHTENAEQLNNILPDDVNPTVVVMNPPFSATGGRMQGERKTINGAVHIEQALKRLEPGGRLVAIVGEGMAADKANFKDWWKKIRAEYTVKANIGVSGQEYKKYGTTFDNQILVIDKTGKTEDNEITGKVSKVEDLIPLLEGVRDARTYPGEQKPTQPRGEAGAEEARPGARPNEPVLPATGGVGPGQSVRAPGQPAPKQPGKPARVEPGEGGAVSGTRPERGEARPGAKPSVETAGGVGGSTLTGSSRQSAEADSGIPEVSGLTVEQKLDIEREAEELSDSVFDTYKPAKLSIPNAKPHPGKLVESAAMASVEPIDPTYQPHIPEKAIKEGKVSLAQLEAVVYAGQAHGETLDEGGYYDKTGRYIERSELVSGVDETATFKTFRKGYFIGDGTGVGKGREIAAILWDNWNQGRKKALWISQNSPLIKDAARDIEGVGWDPNLLFDLGKVKLHSDIPHKQGIGFVGYGTLKMEKSSEGKKVSRLQQIANWLGPDFDGVIAFDESHNMGNAVAVRGRRGMTKPSATALAGIQLQNMLPKARVLYVSATGATEVMNLAYATRLGLWGAKTPFGNARAFVQDISAGGIGIMEMVAQNMKAMGVYAARSLSYDDVKYDRLEHTLTPQQREVYDEMAGAWQGVLKDIHAAMRLTGAKDDEGRTLNSAAVAAAMSKFWGTNQRFWNQIITAMQMPSVVSSIENDMKAGNSVVIQLVNTNEAAQERAIARLEEGEELEDLDLTPRDALMEYVKNSFPVQQFEEYTDENGNVKSRPVVDSMGNPVENREAVAMREELLNRLGSIRVPDGPLEIILNHFGTDTVAEVTGRTRRVVYKDTPQGKKRVSESWGKNKGMADADLFMDGKKRILVFSYAGGTGRSYHADLTAKNQQLRKQYLVQAGWRADRAVQGLGRTHRTNQKQAPEWILVTTDLQGQKRFISSIARRLDQLGALTRGERKAGSQGLFSARDNLESQEAREALRQLIVDMFHGQAEMTIGEFEQATGLTGLIDPNTGALNESRLPDIAQFLNRILNMKIAEQDKVFRMFSYRHDIKVAEAIRRGTLDEGMQTIRAKRTEKIQEQTVYRDSKTKAETKYVEVELTHDAKRLDYATSRTYADNGYVRNIKSGRVWALGKQKSKTDTSTGEVKLSYVAIGTNYNYHSIPVDETNDPTKYEKIPKDKAQKPWEDEYDSMPAEVKERVHMVTGAILPIWDRLPAEGQKVYRLNVEGRNIIGRVIPRQYLDTTLKSLGATASKTEYKAPDIFANVLHRGYKYRLSNDWRIERRKVAGDYRIELIGPYYTHMGELRKYGIFEERISYQTRYFIPTNKETGTKAIEEIISSRPVTDEEIPHGAKAGEITEKDIEAGVIAYSVRDLHRRGLLKVAKIDDVKKFFPGQEVGKDRNGNIYVKTRGGKYVTLYRVDHIEPNAVVILAGYGKTKFAPGSVIPGAFGQKSTGGYYIKLHRTFGDTWTLAHESMHFMETAGIINERDVEVLKAHIRNLHRDGRWDPANRKDIGGPEDRANFIADRLAIPEQRGPIGRIILRIRAFIDGILETFGIRNPESILRGIESGRIFDRKGLSAAEKNAMGYAMTSKPGAGEITTKKLPRTPEGEIDFFSPEFQKELKENDSLWLHGATEDISSFSPEGGGYYGGAVYLTKKLGTAEFYGKKGGGTKVIDTSALKLADIENEKTAKQVADRFVDEYTQADSDLYDLVDEIGEAAAKERIASELESLDIVQSGGWLESEYFWKTLRDLGFDGARNSTEAVIDPAKAKILPNPARPQEGGGDQYFSVITPDIPDLKGERYAPAIIPARLAPMVDSIVQPGILKRAWDELRYQAQDKFLYLNKAQSEAERRAGRELPEAQDAYLAETRYHGMAAAAIEDFDEKHVDPLLELMSENDITVDQADEYLHARHAREANERLRNINPDREDNDALSGMTDEEADRILERISRGPKAQAFQRIARMVDAITKARRDLLIEAGLETEETIAKWEETYQHYVPLMREGKSEAMPRKGRGFEVRGGQKLRAGSTREVVNILANVVAQHEATIVRAEKAKVSRAFLEFAKAHRGPWKIDVPEKTASFDEDGLIVYRANPLGYMLADNVLAVRVDGKDHHVTFDERDLDGMKILSALKNLDAADMGAVTRAVAKISRWLAVINTSLNPEFIISNFARDIQTAAYNMADNEADAIRMKAIKQVGSAFKGIREYQDNNRDTEWARWFNRFRNAGGQTGWIQSYETIQDREKALISKIEDMKHGKIRSVKRGLTAAFDYIADMNTAVENAIRLSVFKNLIEANVPESKAAKIAKELTVNFNRKGNMGPVLNAFYLFYNASIQGSARLIMAGAKSRKVRKLMGATIVFAAALDIMNRAVGGDDDDGENRYDKIAPWIKDRNMIIMLPGNGGHIQIPLPWGYNIFHVMGQAAGEVLTKKNNKATASALRVGGAIVSAFNPMGGESSLLQMISPTLLDPFVQWAENKDWSGRKLRPSANPYAEKPSSQTYWHSARVPSKWIAKTLNELTGGDEVRPGKIDISPESIDLAIDTVTGGAGKFVSNLISTPIKYAKGEDVETYEIPFLRRVYGKAGKQVLTQEYYENMDSVRLVQRQLSHYKNDPAKVREIAQEYKSEVRLIARMKATQKAMKDLKDQLKAAENIKDPAVRKAREKKIDEVMQKIMTGFNKNYNLMKNRED